MHMSQRCAIGIDVGGTKTAGGLVDLDGGMVLERRIVATQPERGGPAVLADTLALAEALATEAAARERSVVGIGLAVCELVDLQGNVTSAHTVDWQGLAVRSAFAHLAPVTLEADVRAHALAEACHGAGRAFELFVFVTVGTGISSCLVQGGRPFAGAHGNALVLASSPLTTTCPACGAVQRPILEEYASGPALVARYNQYAAQHVSRAEDVVAAAETGDFDAREILRSAGAALGVSLGWLVNVLDPEALIIGGGLGMAGGLYWEQMVAATREHIWSRAGRNLPILPAALGPDAGMIGAALTALG